MCVKVNKMSYWDEHYLKNYGKYDLNELKKIYKNFEEYPTYTDANGTRVVTDKSDEKKWLEKRIQQLENPPVMSNTQSSTTTNPVAPRRRYVPPPPPKKDNPAPGAPKGGKTRKHSKKSKKSMKRKHRK